MRFPSIEGRKGTFLPEHYWPGHDLCFFLHDIMARMLTDGQRAGAFHVKFELSEDEINTFNTTEEVFQWLDRKRTPEDRAAVLVATMFPAIISDMLHCIYEVLESSRKAKLNISYMLLRKPIQESLYVLEAVTADRNDFATKLTESPTKLWSQGIGGHEAHRRNIAKVLQTIGDVDRFSAEYLAQLRYDKSAEDGFDGICNKAMHLFTNHKAIETEPMNINFIFSNWDSKESQWSFLYTRLPYLLTYAYRIVENVCASISPTSPAYLEELERRLAAHVLLWNATLDETYASGPLLAFAFKRREWLFEHCRANGHHVPQFKDLVQALSQENPAGVFGGGSVISRRRQKCRAALHRHGTRACYALLGSAPSPRRNAFPCSLGHRPVPTGVNVRLIEGTFVSGQSARPQLCHSITWRGHNSVSGYARAAG